MDWYEMRVCFHRDPKVRSLRVRLKNPLAEAYVLHIYSYCYEQEQGRFEGAAAVELLEDAAEWRGARGALVEALVAERFVDREGEALVVHGVEKRLGEAMVRRANAANRKDRFHIKNAFDTRAERVPHASNTKPEPGGNVVPNKGPDQTRPDQSVCTANGQHEGVWGEVLSVLRQRARTKAPREVLARWLEPLVAAEAAGELVLAAPTEYHRTFVADEYAARLQELLAQMGRPLKVRVITTSERGGDA